MAKRNLIASFLSTRPGRYVVAILAVCAAVDLADAGLTTFAIVTLTAGGFIAWHTLSRA